MDASRFQLLSINDSNKEQVINDYIDILESFHVFLDSGKKPGDIDDDDFQLFRPICANLVNKDLFQKELMKFFD